METFSYTVWKGTPAAQVTTFSVSFVLSVFNWHEKTKNEKRERFFCLFVCLRQKMNCFQCSLSVRLRCFQLIHVYTEHHTLTSTYFVGRITLFSLFFQPLWLMFVIKLTKSVPMKYENTFPFLGPHQSSPRATNKGSLMCGNPDTLSLQQCFVIYDGQCKPSQGVPFGIACPVVPSLYSARGSWLRILEGHQVSRALISFQFWSSHKLTTGQHAITFCSKWDFLAPIVVISSSSVPLPNEPARSRIYKTWKWPWVWGAQCQLSGKWECVWEGSFEKGL